MLMQQSEFEPRPWSRKLFAPLCILALAVGILLLSEIGFIKATELWTADWRAALFSENRPSQHDQLALVLITDETLQDSATRIPVDRRILAKVIRAVASSRPAAIGLDIVFLRPPNSDQAADRDLLDAFRYAKAAHVPIVLGAVDERARASPKQIEYHRAFLARAGGTAAHIFMDRKAAMFGLSDQVVREMAEPPSEDNQPPSFALALARVKRPDAAAHNQQIAWLLPPADGSPTFLEFEARDLVGLRSEIEPQLAALEKKIVLIGTDLADIDRHLTPLSVVDGLREAGVRIHAQLVAQLIDDRQVRQLDWLTRLSLLLALCTAGYIASRNDRLQAHQNRLIWAGSMLLALASIAAFRSGGLIVPCIPAVAAWAASITLGHNIDKLYQGFEQLAGRWRNHVLPMFCSK